MSLFDDLRALIPKPPPSGLPRPPDSGSPPFRKWAMEAIPPAPGAPAASAPAPRPQRDLHEQDRLRGAVLAVLERVPIGLTAGGLAALLVSHDPTLLGANQSAGEFVRRIQQIMEERIARFRQIADAMMAAAGKRT
jgi:hypothetical protein